MIILRFLFIILSIPGAAISLMLGIHGISIGDFLGIPFIACFFIWLDFAQLNFKGLK